MATKPPRTQGKPRFRRQRHQKPGGFVAMSEWIEIVDKIDHAGGRISVADGQLRIVAPQGTLTAADAEILRRHRDGLIEALTPRSIPRSTPRSTEDQADQDDHRHIDESMIVDPVACEKCGSLECWLDLRDGRHCMRCDPPIVAQRLRQAAARIRQRDQQRRTRRRTA